MEQLPLILILISKLCAPQVDIAIPEVFVGGLLGAMLIFLFSAWACAAVGRVAQEVVKEVRRQFIERPGIMVWYFRDCISRSFVQVSVISAGCP